MAIILIFFILVSLKRKSLILWLVEMYLSLFASIALIRLSYNIGLKNSYYSNTYISIILAIIICCILGNHVSTKIKTELSTSLREKTKFNVSSCYIFLALGATCTIFLKVFWQSLVLPAMDPIATIVLSREIFSKDTLPQTHLPYFDNPFVYPPGLPILLSQLWFFGENAIMRTARDFYVMSISLAPAAFAFAYSSNFKNLRSKSNILILYLSFFIGFFLVERSLLLAPIFAGKNSQIITGTAIGIWLGYSFRDKPNIYSISLSAISLCGIFLTHYSTLYLLIAILVGSFFVSFLIFLNKANSQWSWASIVSFLKLHRLPILGFCLGTLLFLPHALLVSSLGLALNTAQKDDIGNIFKWSYSVFIWRDSFFEIFWNIRPWPHKEKLVLTCGIFSLVLFIFSLRTPIKNRAQELSAGFTLFVSILICVLFATGKIPGVPLNWNYTRWFVFFITASLFSITIYLFFITIFRLSIFDFSRKHSSLLYGAIFLVFIIVLSKSKDFKTLKEGVNRESISTANFKTFSQEMKKLSISKNCVILAESSKFDDFSFTREKLLNYTPFVSDCLVDSGTWTYYTARENILDNEINFQYLETRLNEGKTVYLLGRKEFLTQIQKTSSSQIMFKPIPINIESLNTLQVSLNIN